MHTCRNKRNKSAEWTKPWLRLKIRETKGLDLVRSQELGSAIGGGLQDTASSLVTVPERAIDMFSGEMVEEKN